MKTVLLFITLFSSINLMASPKVNESYDFYKIYPSQVESLGSELDLKADNKANGKNYRARAQWDVQLDYKWEVSGSNCKISSVTTAVNVNYVMPKLFSESVSTSIKDTFNKYYLALMHHEKGHKNTGVRAAKELALIIRNMPSMSNCQKLSERVTEKSNSILQKYRQLDKNFDKYTKHGHTQGAHI